MTGSGKCAGNAGNDKRKAIRRMTKQRETKRDPGVCIPWEEKRRELPPITGDEKLVERKWEDIDTLGYIYIWHCLLSF